MALENCALSHVASGVAKVGEKNFARFPSVNLTKRRSQKTFSCAFGHLNRWMSSLALKVNVTLDLNKGLRYSC